MERKTWATMDKTSWGPGPWQDEPDKEQWQDEATGYACLLKRAEFSGALCGYVGIPEGHPWHGAGGPDNADVHGGITYSGLCQEGPEESTICHVPGPGEPEPLYWIGFDCAHAWDVCPAMEAREGLRGWPPIRMGHESYKTAAFVKAECASLARQAADAAAEVSSPRS